MIISELFEAPQQCPECGGISFSNLILAEKKDACYHKVKASAKVWPSAYASGRLVQCRKKGSANYGNKSEGVAEEYELAGVGVAYDLGRRAYQERKTIRDNPYSATREARKYDEWEKGLERGKHDANDAKLFRRSVGENAGQPLSVQQLATISDTALDQSYGYGRSTPGNTFGWQANLKSAAYAKQMIDQGVTDIEAISDAIHKGWNTTAQAFVQDPEQFDDTAKLAAAGKLEAKLQQRAQLMKQNYSQLPEEEKEKDRVVARALLQAIRGEQQQGMAEGQLELNTPDPVVVVQDLKGKILDKINLSVAAQKYKLGPPQNIKTQLAHQNYTTIGNYVIVSPMSGQPQDQTTTGQKQAFTATEGEQRKGADYRDPKEVDYDDEYDAMVSRVKKLAGLGPMRTVYDPTKRVYRNMPTAVQPKK